MKRLVSLLLALMMCLCTANLAIAESTPTELTIAVVRRTTDITESFNEKMWVKDAEEALNVKLNFVELIEGAVDEPLAALLAGDLPDVFFMGMQFADSLITMNSGLFRPITEEEIKTYAPTYYNLAETYAAGWRESMTYPDGNMYGMMSGPLTSEQHLTQGVFVINTAWLEKLGLEKPTTLDELYNVLKAFKEQDPNGNGEADEIPIDFCNSHYTSNILKFASSWGLAIDNGTYYNVVDGNAVGTVNTPEFREFLEYYHKLGQEGLFNLEGFSQTGDQYAATIDSLRVGCYWCWAPYSFVKSDARFDYEGFVLPAAEGKQTKVLPNQPDRTNRNGWVITKECENWEIAMQLYDYWCDPTRARDVAEGARGIGWEWLDEESQTWTTLNAVDPETASEEEYSAWVEKMKAVGYEQYIDKQYNGGNTIGYVNNSPFVTSTASYDVEANPELNQSLRLKAIREFVAKDAIGESIPKTIVSAEAQEELDFMTDGLKDLINGFAAESVINGVTDESWEAFQADLEKYNYSFYIEWYNKLCNGEL